MEISSKWKIVGSVVGVAGLITFIRLEGSVIGNFFNFQNFAINQHQENLVAGPNTDLAKALDILKTAAEKATVEYKEVNERLAKAKGDLEELLGKKTAAIQDLETTRADVAAQKAKIAEELAKNKQEFSNWKATARQEIAGIQAEFAKVKSERDAAIFGRDDANQETPLMRKDPPKQPSAGDKAEGNRILFPKYPNMGYDTLTKPPTAFDNPRTINDLMNILMVAVGITILVKVSSFLFGGATTSTNKGKKTYDRWGG